MNTVIICDDNVEFCNLMEKLLEKYKDIYGMDIVKFYSGGQLREYCRDNKFDIVFLDIELGEENGLKIARSLKEINPKSLMIYISSHDSYYVDMVQAEPFRFIKKDIGDLKKFESIVNAALSDAIKRLNDGPVFTFEFNRKKYTIGLDKIMYFYSAARTIHICGETGDGPGYYYGKIDDLYESLQKIDADFVRINKSYIVNMNYVEAKSKRQIVIEGKKMSLTSKYRDDFLKKYYSQKN